MTENNECSVFLSQKAGVEWNSLEFFLYKGKAYNE